MEQPDPFDLLGLEPRFDLDEGALRRAWLKASGDLHPDRVGEDEEAAARLAEINRAKRALEDPERRARALLARIGGTEGARGDELPDGFLMEILGVRQEMEEAVEEGDRERLAEFERWAEDQRKGYIERVGRMFERLRRGETGDWGRDETLRAIRLELNAWRYIERMIEQLDPDYDPARADFKD